MYQTSLWNACLVSQYHLSLSRFAFFIHATRPHTTRSVHHHGVCTPCGDGTKVPRSGAHNTRWKPDSLYMQCLASNVCLAVMYHNTRWNPDIFGRIVTELTRLTPATCVHVAITRQKHRVRVSPATAVTLHSSSKTCTRIGTLQPRPSPCPSSPCLPHPNVYTSPVVDLAIECRPPAATEAMHTLERPRTILRVASESSVTCSPTISLTTRGVCSLFCVPWPSCPSVPHPNVSTSPAAVHTAV